MSDEATTVTESEGNPPVADATTVGSPADGSTTAVKSDDAGSLATPGGADPEARVREWQARYDKAQAELARVTAEAAAAADTATAPVLPSGPSVFDAMAMYDAKNELKTEFPHADPAVFADLSSYGNVDELRVAADRSHSAKAAEREATRKEVEAEVAAKLAAQGIVLKDEEAGPPTGAKPPSTIPTMAEIAGMSFAERDAFEQEHGKGSIAKILENESSKALYKGGLEADS